MASLNQLVSEISHAVGHPNNHAVRESIKLFLIQTRNEIIRRSYENHSYVDRVLTQRYRVSLIDVTDGDIKILDNSTGEEIDITDSCELTKIKRTESTVPRPVRLINNLPFDRVSTVGYKTNIEIPFIKETSARFTKHLPGMCRLPRYDYINGYIYIFPPEGISLQFGKIIIESAFEHPTPIEVENGIITELDAELGDNEWLLSEDMIGQIKEIIYKRDFFNQIRENNEKSINTNVI